MSYDEQPALAENCNITNQTFMSMFSICGARVSETPPQEPIIITTFSPAFICLPGLGMLTLGKLDNGPPTKMLLEDERENWKMSVAKKMWIGIVKKTDNRGNPLKMEDGLLSDSEYANRASKIRESKITYELMELSMERGTPNLSPKDLELLEHLKAGNFERALEVQAALLDTDTATDHPLMLSTFLCNKALLMLALEASRKQVMYCFHEALQYKKMYLPKDHPSVLDAMEQLAIALHCCGEFKRSLKFFQALKSFQDDGTPESARLWNSIGCVQFNLLRGSFALQCFTRTVYSPKATYLTRAIARANLGHAQLSHGLKHDGGQSLRLAVEELEDLLDENSPMLRSARENLSMC